MKVYEVHTNSVIYCRCGVLITFLIDGTSKLVGIRHGDEIIYYTDDCHGA